jgi:hypothetical protein
MKIRHVGAKLFHEDGHTDRQTEMTAPILTHLNFATLPINDVNDPLLNSQA